MQNSASLVAKIWVMDGRRRPIDMMKNLPSRKLIKLTEWNVDSLNRVADIEGTDECRSNELRVDRQICRDLGRSVSDASPC
jgi:hypothetical protein